MMNNREKALERDLLLVASELEQLRAYMTHHLNADAGMLPNDFWSTVDMLLEQAQLLTDIEDFFPDKPLVTYRE